jgi:Protein of unknown function (DUF3592)
MDKIRFFVLLLGLGAIGFALIPGYQAVRETLESRQMLADGVTTAGEVFDYRLVGTRSKYQTLRPVARFCTVQGEEIEFIVPAGNTDFPRGTYPVLYRADNPKNATIDAFATLWRGAAITGAAALALLMIGGIMLRAGLKLGR